MSSTVLAPVADRTEAEHVPPAFLSGVTGEFFKALSLTIAISLVVSFFVSWLVVPLLAERVLRARDTEQQDVGPAFERVLDAYRSLLGTMLRHRWLALVPVLIILTGGWLAYPRLASGFMPTMDEGGFVLDYFSRPGTSIRETDRMLRQVESILQETPEVQTYSRRTGLQLGGGLTEANQGDFFIRLKDGPRRSIEQVMDEVRAKVEEDVPGLQIELIQLMEDLIGDLTAVPQPIEVLLQGEDQSALFDIAPRVAEELGKIPGVVDVNDGRMLAGDALEIRVDPVKAAVEGLNAAAASAAVREVLEGTVATQYQVVGDAPKVVGIRVWTLPRLRKLEDDLAAIRLAAPDGHQVPLARIADIVTVTGQPQIVRDDMRRTVAVTARISGADLGSTIARVREALASPGLLTRGGHTAVYRLGGLYQQQQQAFADLLRVFAAAVVLVFILLLFWYESVRVAICLIVTSLLALPGVAAGLWLMHTEVNISSMMGLAMIVGSVTEVGVFLTSELMSLHPQETPNGESPRKAQAGAISAAATSRLRPIAMTSIAAVLSMLPLVLGVGGGTAMLRPLAVAIMTGLILQLPLVLLVLPVMLSIAKATRERY